MAGFDFEVEGKPDEDALQRALLRWMQGASRELGLRLTYRKTAAGFWVSLDGALPAMQSLPARCWAQLDVIAAITVAPRDLRRRRRILGRVVSAFERRLDELSAGVGEIADLMRSEGWASIPRSLDFDRGSKSHLDPTLDAFRNAIILRITGQMPSRTAIEECHTVIEHLMNALLEPAERRCLSFGEKIGALGKRGLLQLPASDCPFPGDDLPAQLKDLKDRRRDAKHRGQGVDSETAERLITAAVTGAHLLLAALRASEAQGAPT